MRRNEFSKSLLGRERQLPHVKNADYRWRMRSERAGVNHMVQGSAADIVMLGMLKLWEDDRLRELGYELVLQIHDEVILEGPEKNAQSALERVIAILQQPWCEFDASNIVRSNEKNTFSFTPALEVNGSAGKTWYDCK